MAPGDREGRDEDQNPDRTGRSGCVACVQSLHGHRKQCGLRRGRDRYGVRKAEVSAFDSDVGVARLLWHMRLWTLHPRYLDSIGLVALWREGLLANAVLSGRTTGYRQHPQLERFRATSDPVASINAYLAGVYAEALRRGYRFDAGKLRGRRTSARLAGTRGQLDFEWSHLLRKLRQRSPAQFRALRELARPRAHPQFRVKRGPIAPWERGATR